MVYLVVAAVCGLLARNIAVKKGRNPTTWAVLGVLFGVFAVIVAWVLPAQNGRTAARHSPYPTTGQAVAPKSFSFGDGSANTKSESSGSDDFNPPRFS